jgi:hypothetical protein
VPPRAGRHDHIPGDADALCALHVADGLTGYDVVTVRLVPDHREGQVSASYRQFDLQQDVDFRLEASQSVLDEEGAHYHLVDHLEEAQIRRGLPQGEERVTGELQDVASVERYHFD